MRAHRDGAGGNVPSTLQRDRRRIVAVSIAMVAIVVAAIIGDLVTGIGFGEVDEGEHVATASVVDHAGALGVRYLHPDTGQEVTAPLRVFRVDVPEPGDAVELVVGADPMLVELLGDRYGPHAFLISYVVIVALAVALAAAAWWRVARIRRLLRSWATPRPAVGVVAAGTGFRRRSIDLHVYALDAQVGETPLCTVPLATLPVVSEGSRFPVEVWGTPRRFGRVAARTGRFVLWPRRRALWRTRRVLFAGEMVEPTPARTVPAPTGGLDRGAVLRRLLWPLLAAVAGLALVIGVAISTVRNAAASDRWLAEAETVVSTVVAHPDDDRIELEVRDSDRTVVAIVDFPEDHPVGTDYPVFVDPDPEVDVARLVAHDYDRRAPIFLATVPLWFVGAWLLWRAVGLVAVSRASRRGPWREYAVRFDHLANRAVAVVCDPWERPVATIPLGVDLSHDGIDRVSDGRRSVIVAGDLGPGATVALWPAAAGPALPTRAVRAPVTDAVTASHEAVPSDAAAGPTSGTTTPVPADVRVRLTSAWPHRRVPELRVVGDRIELFAPQWFGRARWQIPLSEVAVIDLTSDDEGDLPWPDEQDVVFTRTLRLAHLPTGGRSQIGTFGLFFRTPQRLPPLRWIHLGSTLSPRRSRSDAGEVVDGALVSAVSPSHAAAVLGGAGVEVVANPTRWWIRHRTVEREPQRREVLIRRDRIHRWSHGASTVVGFAAVGSLWLLERHWGVPAACLTGALAALWITLRLVSKHAMRDD